jgi:hypothetical protein
MKNAPPSTCTMHVNVHVDACERLAREVSCELLADVRTVRKEMREPGSVRGLIGQRVRARLATRPEGLAIIGLPPLADVA